MIYRAWGFPAVLSRGIPEKALRAFPGLSRISSGFLPSGKEKTHKHKQICGIVPGLGGCQKVVYVFFSGHSLWGRRKHINKIPPKIPGQSRENFVYVFFFFMCIFRSQSRKVPAVLRVRPICSEKTLKILRHIHPPTV